MLDSASCVPCQGNEPPLDRDTAQSYLIQINEEWTLIPYPDHISRDFKFNNFMDAVTFINTIATIAEQEGHHPNISLHDYNMVRVDVYTHKIKGLHKNDFILAAKIDKAFNEST